jgi:hypothetical protein
MATTFYYRLPSDNDVDCILWSGRVSTDSKTHAAGVTAVREAIGADTLPKNTLVVSEHELSSGQWGQQRIREATLPTRKASKKYAKTVADVPTSFDEVQAMLKKFGLA